MQFIVSSSQLLQQLQVLVGVVNTNNTLPILDNFLFELTEDQLKITVSDIETIMSSSISVQSEYTGIIALNARLLLDAVKTFPEQPLTFIVNEKNNTSTTNSNKQHICKRTTSTKSRTNYLIRPVK